MKRYNIKNKTIFKSILNSLVAIVYCYGVILFGLTPTAKADDSYTYFNCNNKKEAQLSNASVKDIEISSNGCRAFLSENSTVMQNPICPIDEGRLFRQGIEVGLHKEDVCNVKIGDNISGIIIDNDSVFTLE